MPTCTCNNASRYTCKYCSCMTASTSGTHSRHDVSYCFEHVEKHKKLLGRFLGRGDGFAEAEEERKGSVAHFGKADFSVGIQTWQRITQQKPSGTKSADFALNELSFLYENCHRQHINNLPLLLQSLSAVSLKYDQTKTWVSRLTRDTVEVPEAEKGEQGPNLAPSFFHGCTEQPNACLEESDVAAAHGASSQFCLTDPRR